MLRVGLTGGISTGKSTVGTMFVDLGCHLLDSDQITHELLEPGQQVSDAVIREFGTGILTADGRIDRRALGRIVFDNDSARSRLNALMHPAIIARQREWLQEIEARDPGGIGIVDAALMIEVGTYRNYDRVVVVTCRPEIQRQRLRLRSGLSGEEIEARIRSQMPLEEKVKFADFVIDNSDDLSDTRRKVEQVNSKLRELAANTSDTPTS